MSQFWRKNQVFLLILGIIVMSVILFHMTLGHISPPLSQNQEFSQSDYALLKNQLTSIITRQDPREAFVLLKRTNKENPAVLPLCHALAHEMGHAAYAKYADFGIAMNYQQEICNSGYLHGVIESYLAESSDITTALLTVCTPYSPGTFTRWQCDHGIGHGVMFATGNDVPKAIRLCEKLPSDVSKNLCVNGVFMENVSADQINHFSKFLRSTDQFYPCALQKDVYKSHCYGYAPTTYLGLHPGKFEEALIWCEKAEEPFRQSCAQGVGSRAILETIENPQKIMRTCMLTVKAFADSCLTGMVNEYINHYGSIEPAERLCKAFPDDKITLCHEAVARKAVLFSSK